MTSVSSVNPYNGEVLATFPILTAPELELKIQAAFRAFESWKHTSFDERKQKLDRLAELMTEQREKLARLDALEMGMPLKEAFGDVDKSVGNVRFFGALASRYLAPRRFEEKDAKGIISYEPLGVVFSIMPWNYPYNQVLRSAVPNIAAGNVVLMKHASNVPQIALLIEQLFRDAGFPEGVYTNLFFGHEMTETIIADSRVIGVNVTGSETVGKTVGMLAGKYLKPSILELGGADPFIVLPDADIDSAVKAAVKGRFSNAGQKCNASKRFFIHASIFDVFVEKYRVAVQSLKVGDPLDPTVDIGPLAKKSAVRDMQHFVEDAVKLGAKILCGGTVHPENAGVFLPTVLTNVTPAMQVMNEEVFGPIAPVMSYNKLEEVVGYANQTRFGLGCTIIGKDKVSIDFLTKEIEAGNVSYGKPVTSYAHLPYGGIKASGYGKELGERGVKAFVNEKVVVE
jgi:succinate-semialdehyde dehydrogenase/glutarate-semialdehyde dehydrogenase